MDINEFRRRNHAQFDRADRALQHVGRKFIVHMADALVRATPGFGAPGFAGQMPDTTKYIPTGRLRGGYNYSRVLIGTTSKGWNAERTEDGPFSAYGTETVARIEQQVENDRMGGKSYLENDVAYGVQIVRGEGNHVIPRNFPDTAAGKQGEAAKLAMQSLRGFR